MNRRAIALAITAGVVAVSILCSLGIWQLQRMEWKEGLLAEIAQRFSAAPVALPAAPQEASDQFLQVALNGALGADELYVLTSRRPHGPGFKVISPFTLADGRRILVDRGFLPEAEKPMELRETAPAPDPARAVGTLFWPNETDSFTPDPDLEARLWFARDLPSMAGALGTEPVLVSLTAPLTGRWPEPAPVAHQIPNNHFNYALTWFALAAVWAVMTALWIRAERKRGAQAA
ncbi:MAG: SURF1 family protein [Pseudomonadota bacterium]